MCHCHWASRGLYASIFRVNYKDCFTLKMKALWSFAMSPNTCPTTKNCHFSASSAARASLQLEVTQKLNVKNMWHTNSLLFTMSFDHIFTGWLWRTAHVVQGQPFLPDRYCIIWISVCRARLSRRLYQGHNLPGLDHISPYIRLHRCSVQISWKSAVKFLHLNVCSSHAGAHDVPRNNHLQALVSWKSDRQCHLWQCSITLMTLTCWTLCQDDQLCCDWIVLCCICCKAVGYKLQCRNMEYEKMKCYALYITLLTQLLYVVLWMLGASVTGLADCCVFQNLYL